MKLLFVSMSARIIKSQSGKNYLNRHMNRKVIKRYSDLCDEMLMILRDSGIKLNNVEEEKSYDPFPDDLAKLEIGFDPYKPISNIISKSKYNELESIIRDGVKWADKVICGSATGLYSDITIKYCKQLNKDYLLLVGGFSYETDWNHGIDGKIVAAKRERDCKRNVSEAPWTLYVTQKALQERYPCYGKTLGCSDVEISDLNPEILSKRLQKINNTTSVITIGTIANLDNKLKGQELVVKALAELKNVCQYKIEYHLLGAGSGKKITELARKEKVDDCIIFDGKKPHDEVYKWLDNIDIYVQPSYSEGLCRSIVEAMSRACPVICTDVGGNSELCSPEFLTRKGDIEDIEKALIKMLDSNKRSVEAKRNFENAHNYSYAILDKKRNAFLREFING